jgi:hypothetical protein
MIRDFIERNKSVFVIGLLTFTIFLSIIIISEVRRVRKDVDSPKLIRVENEIEIPESTSSIEIPENGPLSNLDTLNNTYSEVTKKYGILLIKYTNKGFVPQNAKAILGQKINWVNDTETSIYISQKTPFFDEFKTPIVLPAKGTLEFILYKDGRWDYQNTETGFSANITILKP